MLIIMTTMLFVETYIQNGSNEKDKVKATGQF